MIDRQRIVYYAVSTDAIPLPLGAGTLRCSHPPRQRDDPTPRLGVTSAKNANQRDPRASADAESARNDLPRAPCPQDILKIRPPNSLDYKARYDTPASKGCFFIRKISGIKVSNQILKIWIFGRFQPLDLPLF